MRRARLRRLALFNIQMWRGPISDETYESNEASERCDELAMERCVSERWSPMIEERGEPARCGVADGGASSPHLDVGEASSVRCWMAETASGEASGTTTTSAPASGTETVHRCAPAEGGDPEARRPCKVDSGEVSGSTQGSASDSPSCWRASESARIRATARLAIRNLVSEDCSRLRARSRAAAVERRRSCTESGSDWPRAVRYSGLEMACRKSARRHM